MYDADQETEPRRPILDWLRKRTYSRGTVTGLILAYVAPFWFNEPTVAGSIMWLTGMALIVIS
jgi:hypothetical protein